MGEGEALVLGGAREIDVAGIERQQALQLAGRVDVGCQGGTGSINQQGAVSEHEHGTCSQNAGIANAATVSLARKQRAEPRGVPRVPGEHARPIRGASTDLGHDHVAGGSVRGDEFTHASIEGGGDRAGQRLIGIRRGHLVLVSGQAAYGKTTKAKVTRALG